MNIKVTRGGLGFDITDAKFAQIRHESTSETGLHHLNGTISMARADT